MEFTVMEDPKIIALYHAAAAGEKSYFEDAEDNRLQLSVTPEGDNVLHVATKFKKKDLVEWLIRLDPSLINRGNKIGDTPLHIAARAGHLEIIELLISYLTSSTLLKETANNAKDTVLHGAVRSGHHEVVDLLIGRDPGLALAVNDSEESPLFLAMDRKLCEIADSILKAAPECSYQGRNGMNVLHAVIVRLSKRKSCSKVLGGFARLLAQFINAVRTIFPTLEFRFWEYDFTQSQIRHDGKEFLKKFIEKNPSLILGADIYGWTPLHYAAHYGIVEAVELLLTENRSSAYKRNNKGKSALHISAKQCHIDVMKKLVDHCPGTIELLDNKCRTPLHAATKRGWSKTVKFFLESQPEDLINKKDDTGNTPMHLAALKRRFGVLLLLAADTRVDKAATNNEGLTAMDIYVSQADLPRDIGVLFQKLYKKGLLRSCQVAATERKRKQWKTSTNGEPQPKSEETEREDKGKAEPFNREQKDVGKGEPIEQEKMNKGKSEPVDQDKKDEGKGEPVDPEKKDEGKAKPVDQEKMDKGKDEPNNYNKRRSKLQWRKEHASTHLLVGTIVATVTFTAVFTMPGGGGTASSHESEANSIKKSAYIVFVIADSFAFSLSVLSMYTLMGSAATGSGRLELLVYGAILIDWAIYGMVIAYASGTYVLLAERSGVVAAALAVACCCIFFSGPFMNKYLFMFRYDEVREP